jgi:isoaspartyl peptidase/L-asparaginase-like protein (Ntn-hydrolase superfamily)
MNSTNAGAQDRWQSAPLYPKRSPVTFKNVEAGLYSLSTFERKPSICSISAVKAAVSDAKVVMEENECIVLDENCADLAFTDCIFKGMKHFLID